MNDGPEEIEPPTDGNGSGPTKTRPGQSTETDPRWPRAARRPGRRSPAGHRSGRRGRDGRGATKVAARLILPALVAVGITAIVAPELFGGAFGWSVLTIAAMTAASAGLVVAATWGSTRNRHSPPVVVAIVVTLAWTIFQVIPLPSGMVETVAPKAALEAIATAEARGEPAPSWIALTRDPGATAAECLKGAILFAMFCAGWLLAAAGHRQNVLQIVAWSTAVMAAVALAHQLLQAKSVFGLITPVYSNTRMLAPLLNENHLAGLLAMGTPVLLALGLQQQDQWRRMLWWSAALMTSLTVLLTLSRGGIAALVGGVCLLALLVLRSRRERRLGPILLAGGILVTVGVSLGVYVAGSAVGDEFEHAGMGKLDLIGRAAEFALIDSPWIGVGRGGFSATFAAAEGSRVRFEFPENLLVQWTAEWGIPVASLLLAALIGALWRTSRERRQSLARQGGLVGLVAIGAHNLVDFSLEMVGVSCVAALLLGAVIQQRPQRRRPTTTNPRRRTLSMDWIGLAVTAVLGLGTVGLAPVVFRGTVRELQATLERQFEAGNAIHFAETMRRAIALHPSEPTFALLASAEALSRQDPAALRWSARAMQLAPGWSEPHVHAALYLLGADHLDQARLEVHAAAERDPRMGATVLCAILQRRPDQPAALLAAPAEGRAEFLDRVSTCLGDDSAIAAQLDEVLAQEAPALVGPHVRRANRMIEARRPDDAADEMREAVDHQPSSAWAQATYGRALIAADRADEAVVAMQYAQRQVPDPELVLRALARAHASLQQEDAMRDAIDQLKGLSEGAPDKLAEALALMGALETSMGNLGHALRAHEQAYRFVRDPKYLEQVARAAERLGDQRRAYGAYSELISLDPGNPRHRLNRDRVARGRRGGTEPAVRPPATNPLGSVGAPNGGANPQLPTPPPPGQPQ